MNERTSEILQLAQGKQKECQIENTNICKIGPSAGQTQLHSTQLI